MAYHHDLSWLAFATIRSAIHFPPLLTTNCIARIPEYRSNTGIVRISLNWSELSVIDWARNLNCKTKRPSKIINAPTLVHIKNESILSGRNQVIKISLARYHNNVCHPDQRDSV